MGMRKPYKLLNAQKNWLPPLPSSHQNKYNSDGKLYSRSITQNKKLLPNILTDDPIKYDVDDLRQSQAKLLNHFILKQAAGSEPLDKMYQTSSLKRVQAKQGNIAICENCQNITVINNKSEINSLKEWLDKILKEIEVLTNKVRQDVDEDHRRLNWKFAAMVIDRLCMILFAIATFTSTFTFSLNLIYILE